MRKYLLLLVSVMLLVGCEAKMEEFSKTCRQEVKSSDIIDTEKKDITYNNKDEITKVVVTRTYKTKNDTGLTTLKGIKDSAKSYNNNLAKSKAIKITVPTDTDNKYVIKYYLDVQKMDDEELETFNLRKNSAKFFNKMKSLDVECK